MKLGWQMGYWGAAPPAGVPATLAEIEQLGFDSVWTAEAWGSDAISPLAWWGSSTTRLRLGTSLMQMSARTPTATAMAAISLDHLSNGRFMLGLGVSGPQVVEGWYGQPFARPLARTREYVDIVRQVIRRDAPVASRGAHYPLPLPDGTGLGRPLKSITHPLRSELPILLGAEGLKNVALAAEIADGWFPNFYSAHQASIYAGPLREGSSKRTDGKTADEFEINPTVSVVIDRDIERAADTLRPSIALYAGGMGAKGANFHFDVLCRLGYEEAATQIRDLFLDGRKDDAAAAVPTRLIEEIALIGPPEKVRDDLEVWKASPVTTMLLHAPIDILRLMAEWLL